VSFTFALHNIRTFSKYFELKWINNKVLFLNNQLLFSLNIKNVLQLSQGVHVDQSKGEKGKNTKETQSIKLMVIGNHIQKCLQLGWCGSNFTKEAQN